MGPAAWAAVAAVGLFAGMVGCLEIGYRLSHRRGQDPEVFEGIGAIEAAVFALLGLLLGFSFAGGTSRLDTRRELIVQEANAVGTAYLSRGYARSGRPGGNARSVPGVYQRAHPYV